MQGSSILVFGCWSSCVTMFFLTPAYVTRACWIHLNRSRGDDIGEAARSLGFDLTWTARPTTLRNGKAGRKPQKYTHFIRCDCGVSLANVSTTDVHSSENWAWFQWFAVFQPPMFCQVTTHHLNGSCLVLDQNGRELRTVDFQDRSYPGITHGGRGSLLMHKLKEFDALPLATSVQ